MEMDSYSRVRSVKLGRSSAETPFGFSVRGGHEHGTGIFVSWVDPRSLPFRQGLKVGDQILRVNGFPVSAALHHECLALMRLKPSLHLKVRSVGMLPVKEKSGDPLTWKLVEEQPSLMENNNHHHHHEGSGSGCGGGSNRGFSSRLSNSSSQHSAPLSELMQHSHQHQQPHPTSTAMNGGGGGVEAKVFIDMSGRNGLGCCICKGPIERPGIFVQSTKANGVAREAGLRPGDQLLQCNGHSFIHVPFAEAVQHLKASPQLRLRVLKGAAADLFPGESSSGYNSSASSLNGDQGGGGGGEGSRHRLNRVTEERPGHHRDHHGHTNGCGVNNGGGGMVLDEGMEWDEVEQVWRSAERETIVIEVKGVDVVGGGPSLRGEELRLVEERKKLQLTQARLLEEALRLEEEKRRWEEEKRRLLLVGGVVGVGGVMGVGGGGGRESASSSNSLAGALHQEILKRSERREEGGMDVDGDEEGEGEGGDEDVDGRLPKPGTVEAKRSIFNNQIDHEKRQQHEQLIEEFKRAHRKMFAQNNGGSGDPTGGDEGDAAAAELIRSRRVQKELDHERQMVAQRVAGIVRQRQLRIERQHQESVETEREIRSEKSPPPPPPMPPHELQQQQQGGGGGVVISGVVGNKVKGPAPNPPQQQLLPLLLNQPKRVLIIEEKQPGGQGRTTKSKGVGGGGNNKGKAPPPPPPPPQRNGGGGGGGGGGEEVSRPESPSPDYSNSPSPTPTRVTAGAQKRGGGSSSVDMQSLESFRLKDPPRSSRKPPPVYFPHGGGGNNNPASGGHTQMVGSSSSHFVEGNNAKNEALSGGILKGAKTISFVDKY